MRAGDKGSPYVVDGERITLRPVFREWVFEAFYAKFVQAASAAHRSPAGA